MQRQRTYLQAYCWHQPRPLIHRFLRLPRCSQPPKSIECGSISISRLEVDQATQGHGVGKMLLVDAIKRTLAVSDEIAIYAMVVDAIDERAERFYRQFGFLPLCSGAQRLLLPLKSI